MKGRLMGLCSFEIDVILALGYVERHISNLVDRAMREPQYVFSGGKPN